MMLTVHPIASIQGQIRPPSDKSLTHRSYMFAGFAQGESHVTNPLRGEDCESTLRCMNQLGLRHEWLSENEVRLIPTDEWQQPKSELDCGNSGTTMRLLAGLLASRPLKCVLIGDESLSKRPMNRIAQPLRLMGARVEGETPPLQIAGATLEAITYRSPVPSAQIKSSVLLAGLGASGRTSVIEPTKSRDHTEIMLRAMGVEVEETDMEGGHQVSVLGGQNARAFNINVPADISSAAFFMVAAAALPDSRLIIQDLSVNPTRTGILDVFRQCGILMESSEERRELGEPVADIEIRAPANLRPFAIEADMVPRLIDEIPVLSVLATQCSGISTIRGARELRVKESDRIETMAAGLRAMGADVETFEDGMSISGPTALHGAAIEARGDHRIAMSFAVAGLLARGETIIDGADAIATSYPHFEEDLMRLSVV